MNGNGSPKCMLNGRSSFSTTCSRMTRDFFKGKKFWMPVAATGDSPTTLESTRGGMGDRSWPAVEVARRNTASPENVYVVQADLTVLRFPWRVLISFIRLVCCITCRTRNRISESFALFETGRRNPDLSLLATGAETLSRCFVNAVGTARNLTTRLPHWAVHALAYPSARQHFSFLSGHTG